MKRMILPVVSTLSVVLTACSDNKDDSAQQVDTDDNPKLSGDWLCFEMDGEGFPVVYSQSDIVAFTSNPDVAGMTKAVFMSIDESYDGILTSHFYYDYADGTQGILEAPLPLSAQGRFPFYQITSYEGDASQAEIVLDCRLSEARILGCSYSIGGISREDSSISFRPNDEGE